MADEKTSNAGATPPHAAERDESAYEDRPSPEAPGSQEWKGFSGPPTGGASGSQQDRSGSRESSEQAEREGGGAADERD